VALSHTASPGVDLPGSCGKSFGAVTMDAPPQQQEFRTLYWHERSGAMSLFGLTLGRGRDSKDETRDDDGTW